MPGLISPEKTGFEVGRYLESRAENPDFVMVEIGHGANPVASRQPFEFTGGRAYIGIEGWLRYPESSFKEQTDYTDRKGKNIFFISQDLGVEVHREGYEEEGGYSWLVGGL